MPTTNPFPLNIVPKVNSPELEAYLSQFGHALYADQNDINKMIDGLNYLYENSNDSTNVQELIDDLKDSVPSEGDTLNKLYQMILSLNVEKVVGTIAERNAFDIPHLPFSILVENDGDGKWAKYQAITTGVNANYIKLSDPDLLNAVMSAAAIKIAYESNSNTNAFTNALKNKLDSLNNSNNTIIAKYINPLHNGNWVSVTTETILRVTPIINTNIVLGSALEIDINLFKDNTSNGTAFLRVYLSNTTTGGTPVATFNLQSNHRGIPLKRSLTVKSSGSDFIIVGNVSANVAGTLNDSAVVATGSKLNANIGPSLSYLQNIIVTLESTSALDQYSLEKSLIILR